MTLTERLRAARRWFENFAEAMDHNPVADLQRRVDWLERQAAAGSAEAEGNAPDAAPR